MKIFLFLLFVVFFLVSCNTTDIQDSGEINIVQLKKEWTHSFEEDYNSVRVYRPSNYKEFQAAWFRQIYFFENNNKCSYLVLAPDDGHYFNQGIWYYKPDTQALTILDSLEQVVIKYKIIELSDEILKLIQL